MNLKVLTNDDLVMSTLEAIKTERKTILVVLEHLCEIESRRLYFKYGYNSLFAMVVTHFCYSEASAQRRINSMRLIREMPEVAGKIESGELTLSAAANVQNFFKETKLKSKSEKQNVIAACLNRSAREVDKELASRNPDREKRETFRYSKGDRLRLSLNISEDLYAKLESLKYELRFPTIEKLLHYLVDRNIFNDKGPENGSKSSAQETPPTDQSLLSDNKQLLSRDAHKTRSISSITKKIVIKRNEEGRCEYVDPETLERCTETHDLQFDHRIPFSKGGPNIVDNLRQLCGQHNRYVWNYEQKNKA